MQVEAHRACEWHDMPLTFLHEASCNATASLRAIVALNVEHFGLVSAHYMVDLEIHSGMSLRVYCKMRNPSMNQLTSKPSMLVESGLGGAAEDKRVSSFVYTTVAEAGLTAILETRHHVAEIIS